MGEQCLQPGEISLLGGREEPPRQLVTLLACRSGSGAGAAGRGVSRVASWRTLSSLLPTIDAICGILVVEHVVKQEHGPLLRREALQQGQHRQRERVRGLGVLGGVIVAVRDDRLGEPLADVLLATGACGAQLVDRQPGGHGGHERARRSDLLAAIERPMHSQQRFLHDVLGFGNAAEHPVADPEGDRPKLLEQALSMGHAATNPFPPAGCAGRHPVRAWPWRWRRRAGRSSS